MPGVSWGHPSVLYLLLAVVLLLAWSLWQVREPRRMVAALMRAAVVALMVLALADPQRVSRFEGNARPVLLDLSHSIAAPMRRWVSELLRNELKFRDDDPAILFGGQAEQTVLGDAVKALAGPGCARCAPEQTNLETALRVLASQSQRAVGPVVLVTDGWENRGQARLALDALAAAQSRLFIFSPPPTALPDVAMTAMSLPRALPASGPFTVSVTMLNSNAEPAAGRVELLEKEKRLETRQVILPPGFTRIDFSVRPQSAGLRSYRASFTADNPAQDAYTEDNSLVGWVGIGAQRKALILTGSPREARYLQSVARQRGLETDTVEPKPGLALGDLGRYAAIVLNNVSFAQLAPATRRDLTDYAERGGALAMVGGDHSFGLGGWMQSEPARALPVEMKPPQHRKPRRALIIVIDKSGSMARDNKLEYAKAAALAAARSLNDDDFLSVIGFDSQPFVVVPLQSLRTSRPYLAEMVNRLLAQGTTYLLPALQEAYRNLTSSPTAIKHIVILTDGKTGGTADMYYNLVSKMHLNGGVTISTIAIGREANVDLLSAISRYGGGAFYQTDNPSTLPEITLRDVDQRSADVTMVERQFRPRVTPGDPVFKSAGGETLPPIKGYVSTELKAGAQLDAYVERDGRREPVVASWHFGSGKTLAVTTDAGERWAADWLRANVFSRLWDQILDWMTGNTEVTASNYAAELGYENGRLKFKLIAYSEETERLVSALGAIVQRPDGSTAQMTLSQDAPGEVSGSIDAARPGVYGIALRSGAGDKKVTFPPMAYSVSPVVLAELPRPYPNYALLERLASVTGGRLNPSVGEVSLSRPTLERRVSGRLVLLVAAMVLLVAEAFARRLTA
jgi:uncharacterized membrane protein